MNDTKDSERSISAPFSNYDHGRLRNANNYFGRLPINAEAEFRVLNSATTSRAGPGISRITPVYQIGRMMYDETSQAKTSYLLCCIERDLQGCIAM